MTPAFYTLTSGACTILQADLVEDVARLLGQDADHVARVLLAERGWYARQEADELAAQRRREDAARQTGALLAHAEARRRTRKRMAIEDVK